MRFEPIKMFIFWGIYDVLIQTPDAKLNCQWTLYGISEGKFMKK